MTAEQLEELLGKVREAKANHYRFSEHQAYSDLLEVAPSLARRVLAAEKLVEALEELPLGDGPLAQFVTDYREASKGATPQ